LRSSTRDAATRLVEPSIDTADEALVTSVREEVTHAIESGEITWSEDAIRVNLVPHVLAQFDPVEVGVASAEEISELKQSLAGFKGGATRLRNDLNTALAELRRTREELEAIRAQVEVEGGEGS
jgi:hypothetical protein